MTARERAANRAVQEGLRASWAVVPRVDLVIDLVQYAEMGRKTVNVHEAKTHLSRLLARVERGDEIVIARGGRPIARLTPYQPKEQERVLGGARGKVWIADDFDGPLPDDLLTDFEP